MTHLRSLSAFFLMTLLFPLLGLTASGQESKTKEHASQGEIRKTPISIILDDFEFVRIDADGHSESHSVWVCRTRVIQKQWGKVMESSFKEFIASEKDSLGSMIIEQSFDDLLPVRGVSFLNAQKFLLKFNTLFAEELKNRGLQARLPTLSNWEAVPIEILEEKTKNNVKDRNDTCEWVLNYYEHSYSMKPGYAERLVVSLKDGERRVGALQEFSGIFDSSFRIYLDDQKSAERIRSEVFKSPISSK